MARYITDKILCEAYLNLNVEHPDPDELEVIRARLHEYVQTRGSFFLGNQIKTRVRLTEGSLIEHLAVVGTIYVAISQYPDFRTGVLKLYEDMVRLLQAFTVEAQFVSEAPNESVVHSEARTGLIGILKGLIDRLQYIKDSAGLVKIRTLTKKLQLCQDDALKVIETLTERREQSFVALNLRDLLFELPESPPERPKLDPPDPGALPAYRNMLKSFFSILNDYE